MDSGRGIIGHCQNQVAGEMQGFLWMPETGEMETITSPEGQDASKHQLAPQTASDDEASMEPTRF
ncbi:hypothetical protein [Planctomycetes bacterium CA13]|uniref:hypothetical protein n=1 Tax=Novipirellula herctigrandis TaxID=2527986 RepID=UPI0011B77CEF